MGFLFGQRPDDQDLPSLFGEAEDFDGTVDGAGQWYYEPYWAIRTLRPSLPMVFVIAGAVNPTKLPIAQELQAVNVHDTTLLNLNRGIDLQHFEYLYITFKEPLTNMGPGHAAAKAEAIAQINALESGRKFCLVGFSEGSAVASDVYDELRTGSLTSRNSDFLGGFCSGNPRRQNGRTFTDPVYGLYPDPATGTSGAATSRLTGTENKWWEICAADDPVTCVSDTSDLGWWIRRFYTLVHQEGGTTVAAVMAEVKANASNKADGDVAVKLFSNLGATGHGKYKSRYPFAAQGDSRSFIQCGIDHVNSLSNTTETPVLHQLRSDSRPVTPGKLVTAGAQVQWYNLPIFTGKAIKVAVSTYDSSGNWISDVAATNNACVITNPKPSSASAFGLKYKTLTGSFKMPMQAVEAKLLFEVAAEVMSTGIVWFKEPRFIA